MTIYRYTGQRVETGTGLYDYGARWYDPAIGRFLAPDTIVPEPGNPQALNRYAYVYNNPLRYIDADGHLPIIPILIVGAVVALKAIDYGWTAWDSYQSLKVINDPNASQTDKATATANLALTAAFEAAEPDDLLPVALPIDDLARKGILKMGQEMGERTAKQALEESTGAITKKPPIVIRENMANRVGPYAQRIGAQTINDFIPPEHWTMQANEAWIKQMRAEGREIIDIGPDFERRLERVRRSVRPDAPAYNLEREVLQGYEKYHKVFQRSGKYWGGVPGLD